MLLLGHPHLGAQNADVYRTKWAGCRKTLAREGVCPAAGPPLGAWNIDIRPEIPLRPAKSRPRALLFGSGGLLQERSKRHSRGLPGTFSVHAAIQTPFWSRFSPKNNALGP